MNDRNLQSRGPSSSKIDALQQFRDVIKEITFNIDAETEGRVDHVSF